MPETFKATEIIGKALYATKNILGYWGHPDSPNMIKFKAGDLIGTVYSYIRDNDKINLWWEFYPNGSKGKSFYVKHAAGSFDRKAVKAQGAKSVEEKVKEEADAKKKEEESGFAYYAEKWGKPILIGAAVLKLASVAINRNKKS